MAKKQEIINETFNIESLDAIMGDRYAVYAKYVIQDRAIPDARDGLKPVQRRIIYSMHRNGYVFEKETKKCAKIVGDVMGKFHPHGDTSIYDALVRMSQNWKMSQPLVHFKGNNGSVDSDPAAAMRYTEAKLSAISSELVRDLDKNTVDMTLNFDDTELEPIVLPSKFPNLFLNGSEGIAIALATEIPPHNLKEICDATVYRLKNPNCTLDELLPLVKGPDFPTGGIIYNDGGIKDIYETGRGKIEIASKVEINTSEKNYNELIVTEIPYGVVKKNLVYSIDEIRKEKTIDGIIDVKDLSSGEDIRIVIELKKEIDPEIILTFLMNKTQLKINYNANIVAICKNHPRTLGLIDYLDIYIEHQIEVLTRSSKYDLNKNLTRLEIVEGLIKASDIIDDIILIIKNSKDKAEAKLKIEEKYGFTELQSEAIVTMRLYKLSNTDITAYLNEKRQLNKDIATLNGLLNSETKMKNHIVNTISEISSKYSPARRSIIKEKTEDIVVEKRDLIAKEDVYVVLTKDGYIKRSSMKSFKSSNDSLPGLKVGDSIILNTVCNTLDYILAFTNKGNYLFIPVHEIIENKYKDEGKHINYLITLPLNEIIVKAFIISDFSKEVDICLVSKFGQIKKSKLPLFFTTRFSKPINCMKLVSDDELADVAISYGNSNLLIILKNGFYTYFNEREIASSGLRTSGVKAISKLKNSEVAKILSFREDEKMPQLLLITQLGYRTFASNQLVISKRLSKPESMFKSFQSSTQHYLVHIEKMTEKVDELTFDFLLNNNEVMKITINDLSKKWTVDNRCKNNIEQLNDSLFAKEVLLTDTERVNQDTAVEETVSELPCTQTQDSDENDSGYEQISIFDSFGD